MRLSISSSNDRLPIGNWVLIWGSIFATLVSSVLFFEWHIRNLGWEPSVTDSAQLWSEQRKRASELGKQAIVLVGASRMQLDIDLSELQNTTHLTPIQLAIDGTTYIPVLENLSRDPTITGTILISVNAYNLQRGQESAASTQWVNYYERLQAIGIEPYRRIHNKVSSLIDSISVIRLEGAKPYTVISKLAFKEPSRGNYLITYPNRSRDANYQKVTMPNFYATRLKRHFGKTIDVEGNTYLDFINAYKTEIEATAPVKASSFDQDLAYLITLIDRIQTNGAKVILVRFPTGKLIWNADKMKYPRKSFWNKIRNNHQASIHFNDYPTLSEFILPDGSHLDYTDKKKFTSNLVKALQSSHVL